MSYSIEQEARFLIERLRSFESENMNEESFRDWNGHVAPSIARLDGLLQGVAEPQVMGRVAHLGNGLVVCHLNSVGRTLPDNTALYSAQPATQQGEAEPMACPGCDNEVEDKNHKDGLCDDCKPPTGTVGGVPQAVVDLLTLISYSLQQGFVICPACSHQTNFDDDPLDCADWAEEALALLTTAPSPEQDRFTEKDVERVARAFWRRIYPYRNEYDKELPTECPVEFVAHMGTALTALGMKPEQGQAAPGSGWVEWPGDSMPVPCGTIVDVRKRGGTGEDRGLAETFNWKLHAEDVTAYRIVKRPNPPAEGE